MGYRQTRDKLHLKLGWSVSNSAIWKSVECLGIHGYIRRRKVPSATGLEHIRYSNILNRNFKAEMPMKKIVTVLHTLSIMAGGTISLAIKISAAMRSWSGSLVIFLIIPRYATISAAF